MPFSEINYEFPAGWSIEASSEGVWNVLYQADDGEARIDYYNILDGIVLLDIDLACHYMPVFSPTERPPLTINWCTRGRCEVDFDARGSTVVETGLVCVSSSVARGFSYPSNMYRGFEIAFDFDRVLPETEDLFAEFGVDIHKLDQRISKSMLALTMKPEGALMHALLGIVDLLATDGVSRETLLAAICHLMTCLDGVDPSTSRLSSAYIQRSQREIARQLYDAIVENPEAPSLVLGIARAYGVSESSLRGYFMRVYGISPAEFARSLVLGRAAKLLASTDGPVSDIALACGYSNPSKFSASFKRAYGSNPLEYRRLSRLGLTGKEIG